MPRVILLMRLCATTSFDAQKVSLILNSMEKVTYFDLSALFSWIYNESQVKNIHLVTLPPATREILNTLDENNDLLIFDIIVTHFETAVELATLLRNRYNDIDIVLIADNPLKHFSDFSSNISQSAYFSKRIECFNENKLYRIDLFLNMIEHIKGRPYVIASNNSLQNEEAFFHFLDLPISNMLLEIPMPKTIYGKNLNWLLYLPLVGDIVPLIEWRKVIQKWETESNAPMTRAPTDKEFEHIAAMAAKYWRFAKRRYPELENALDLDVSSFNGLARHQDISVAQLRSFADSLGAELQRKLVNGLGILQRGGEGYQKKFFDILREMCHTENISVETIPKCTVITFTYNHEKFISDCIEGVAKQKLNCSLEHIIVDDASTDSTPYIVEEMAKKYSHIKPIFFKNKPSSPVGAAFWCCKSQYVALCDGDDYFTDDRKLQKQIDFLDAHPECGLCFHCAKVVFEDDSKSHIYPPLGMLPGGVKESYGIHDLLQGNPMQTSAVMYRWRFREQVPPWFDPRLIPGDWYWHLLHAETGKAGFIPEVMSVYRRHGGAVYSSADRDTMAHRLKHGMKELEFYDHCDRHFSFKYHKDFSTLANGVFANFLEHYAQTADASYMDEASLYYPIFAKDFLENLTIVSGKNR